MDEIDKKYNAIIKTSDDLNIPEHIQIPESVECGNIDYLLGPRENPLKDHATTFDKISSKEFILYVSIFVGIVIFFQYKNISIGALFGCIIAIITIYLVYNYNNELVTGEKKIHHIKSDRILPKPENIQKYTDMTDFIFSIQDFYTYNPQVFEDIVQRIDDFLNMFASTMIDAALAGENYFHAERYKQLILTDLRSIMIMIPSDKKLIKKLDESVSQLDTLLNNYLIQIYEKNKNYIKTNGYFNNTKVINLEITPYNSLSE
jgi:hypothetical protein